MRLFLSILLLASSCFAAPFEQLYGSYEIANCQQQMGSHLPEVLSFCRYAKLNLKPDMLNQQNTFFEFTSLPGTRPLGFGVSAANDNITAHYVEHENTATLTSEDPNMQSLISFMWFPSGNVKLTMQTRSFLPNGAQYSYELLLRKIK